MAPGSMVWIGGHRAPALRGQRPTSRGPLGVAQDLARDRLALEALDHQPGRAEAVARAVAVGHHRGHRDARRPRGVEQGALGLHPPRLRRAVTAVHLQDERSAALALDQVERAGDPGGATREAAQVVDDTAQPRARARPPAPRCSAGLPSPPYSTGTTGLPPSSSWCRYSQMPYPVCAPPAGSS